MHATIRLPTDTHWIAPFDGLRFIAAIGVVLHHTNSSAFKHWAIGNISVAIFFCLSGFLAFYILDRDKHQFGRIDYGYYLFRRVLRIWPAYFVFIFVALYIFGNSASRAHQHIGTLFTFTMNWDMSAGRWTNMPFPHLWTIAVEEQFYVIAPLIWIALRSRWWLHFIIAAFVLANAFRTYFILRGTLPFGVYYLTLTWADMFVGGAALAKIYSDGWRPTWQQQYAMFWGGLVWLAITAWIWAPAVHPPFVASAPLAYAIPVFGCLLLIASILPANKTPVGSALSIPQIRYVGQISYSIYLYHLLAIAQAAPLAGSTLVHNCAVIALCLFYAQMSYLLIEKPALGIKDSLRSETCYGIAKVMTWTLLVAGTLRIAMQ